MKEDLGRELALLREFGYTHLDLSGQRGAGSQAGDQLPDAT
ncbi:MAG: hypothetical protein ACXW31_07435 [Thermoanaerobaculia bacterium]